MEDRHSIKYVFFLTYFSGIDKYFDIRTILV